MRGYGSVTLELSVEEREELILQHMPQVRLIARRIHENLPGDVSMDDLVSAGVIGLIMAVDNYEPSHPVKLKTYAEYKIRGAILDSLRSMDWASRQRRTKHKGIEAAITSAQAKLQRTPTEEEIAGELGVTLEDYRARLVEVQGLTLGSLNATIVGTQNQELLSIIPDAGELPSVSVERRELEKLIAEALDKLPKQEKLILGLYYQEELTLREISEIVHLGISRVSELKTTSILRLRAAITERWPTTRGR
jgi:RNA polymerase sigma factor for flagellar operon FliA